MPVSSHHWGYREPRRWTPPPAPILWSDPGFFCCACKPTLYGSLHPEAGSCIVAEIPNVEDQMKRNLLIGSAFVATIAVLGVGSSVLGRKAQASGVEAPRFEVDPMWPKPLPNHWLLGNTIGVSVDGQDHIWIIHRGGSLERMENYAAA